MKSTLLFKLPPFVYRPDVVRTTTLGICVLGSSPFGGALEKLAQRPVDGKIVKLQLLGTGDDASDCDFIFISRSESNHLDTILRRIGKPAIVTVSDIDGFAKSGGMVEFSLGGKGSGVSILINSKAAQKQGIEFNAQLLRLAKVVEP